MHDRAPAPVFFLTIPVCLAELGRQQSHARVRTLDLTDINYQLVHV